MNRLQTVLLIPGLAVLASLWLACAIAEAEEANRTIPTPVPAENSDDNQKHLAVGDIKYGEKWMPIMDLFTMYYNTTARGKGVATDGLVDKNRLTEINKALFQILGDWREKKKIVDAERAKAIEVKDVSTRLLAIPRPRPPDPASLVPEEGKGHLHSDGTFTFTVPEPVGPILWAAYQTAVAKWEENRRLGLAQLRLSVKRIAECDKELQAITAARTVQERSLLVERVKVNERLRSIPTEVGSKMNQAKDMAAALRASPRLCKSKGIIEWRGDFYLLADLERMYKEIKTEIDDARAEAEAKGKSVV